MLRYRLGYHLPLGVVALRSTRSGVSGWSCSAWSCCCSRTGSSALVWWRAALRAYLGLYAVSVLSLAVATAQALSVHPVQVDGNGGLTAIDNPTGWYAQVTLLLLVMLLFIVAFIGRQVLSWRRSSGERRQQLKWLAMGAAVTVASAALALTQGASPATLLRVVSGLGWFGFAALPVSIGVAILKYRLYDIDRIISRTLAYALVTGLLVGVYAGLVLLATEVLGFTSSVAVAAATLAAAALFNPVRLRVQRVVDRRFNRARYNADQLVAEFSARMQDAVGLDTVSSDLTGVIQMRLAGARRAVALRRCAVTGRSGVRAARWAALLVGALALAVTVAEVPLAGLARQSVLASGGSLPFPFTLAYGVVGLLLAWRKPGNLIGWLMLAAAAVGAASESASFYLVADYRLQDGQLPLGWLAVLAQPGWAPCIVALGLIVLLFPDGRLPGPRWRWFVAAYLAVGAAWLSGAYLLSVGAILGHHIQVDSGGNLLVLDHPAGGAAWWGVVQDLFLPVLLVSWLATVAGQVASYRRSSGERRQQLKWLLAGAVGGTGGLFLAFGSSGTHGLLGAALGLVSWTGLLALPACIGVAVLRYRLFDIDRLVSRTLAYAVLTGLLVGVYAGLVLLAIEVLRLGLVGGRGSGDAGRGGAVQPVHGCGCSGWWTGGSTGPGMTPSRWWRRSRPA